MNIADTIISKCGRGNRSEGVKMIAFWLKRTTKTVYCWAYPRERGGTDGVIPAKDQITILQRARAIGIDLKPEDFFGLSDLPPLGTPANSNEPTLGAGTDPRDDKAGEKVT